MTFLEDLAADFQKMLDYREAVGYATNTYKSMVLPFIAYCGNNHLDGISITQEMIDGWLEKYNYSQNNQAVFIACLRQYTKFINFLGKVAFIPDDDYSIKRISYNPSFAHYFRVQTNSLLHIITCHNIDVSPSKLNLQQLCKPISSTKKRE